MGPAVGPSSSHDDEGAPRRDAERGVELAVVVGLLVVGFGLLVGASRLHDNSFLTHLATGRLIWETGIPRADPYSFTAPGEPWVVQSWFASWLFGGLEELGGLTAIRAAVAVLTAVLAFSVWAFTSSCSSLVLRIALVVVALAASLSSWGERPLTIGLVCFSAVIGACLGRLDPRWLVPVAWVWVNSHGSFPLGLVVIGAHLLGAWADGDDVEAPRRSLAWFTGGLAIAAVNPLGPRLLWFPLELLERSDLLRSAVVEWQPPAFNSVAERAFLLLLVVGTLALVRHGRWRAALPLVVFGAAALLSRRNIPIAVLAVLPGISAALPGVGSLTGRERRTTFGLAAAASAALTLVLLVTSLQGEDTALGGYPVSEVEELLDRGVLSEGETTRMATPDYVGNYFHFRFGTSVPVFVDDRFDMYPVGHVEAYADLVFLSGDPSPILDRESIELVLWKSDTPLGRWLAASEEWAEDPMGEDGWTLYCRDVCP